MRNYDFINYSMELDNEQIAKTPFILIARYFRLRERHKFLKKMDRNQYDPQKPLYVSPNELALLPDEVFAEKLAKRPLADFQNYLRTL